MSAYLTGRSAQSGFCSHTCRWEYDVAVDKGEIISAEKAKKIAESGSLLLQEHQRPGEFFPVFEGDDFTAVLSSKDLRMIEHLEDMKNAGVDSLKIEGRMKSIYYVAMVTRAYRKAIDMIEGKISAEEAKPYIDELENVSHRESTTGFYYNKADADKTTIGASDSKYQLSAEVGKELSAEEFDKILNDGLERYKKYKTELENMHPLAREARLKDISEKPDRAIVPFEKKAGWKLYECTALNKINVMEEIEFISPSFCSLVAKSGEWELISPETGLKLNWVCDSHPCLIYTKYDLPDGTLIRTLDPDYVDGKIRDTGR